LADSNDSASRTAVFQYRIAVRRRRSIFHRWYFHRQAVGCCESDAMIELRLFLDTDARNWRVIAPNGHYRECAQSELPQTVAKVVKDFADYLTTRTAYTPGVAPARRDE
jgi:hypothetical protein